MKFLRNSYEGLFSKKRQEKQEKLPPRNSYVTPTKAYFQKKDKKNYPHVLPPWNPMRNAHDSKLLYPIGFLSGFERALLLKKSILLLNPFRWGTKGFRRDTFGLFWLKILKKKWRKAIVGIT